MNDLDLENMWSDTTLVMDEFDMAKVVCLRHTLYKVLGIDDTWWFHPLEVSCWSTITGECVVAAGANQEGFVRIAKYRGYMN